MKSLIVTKIGVLSEEQKEQLKETDFVLIETDKPEEIKIIDSLSSIGGDAVLRSALSALSSGNDPVCRNVFGDLIRKEIQKRLPQ